MYIFQRYNHPLDIARIRQFLHEGARRWRMLASAEVVPGLIHISLFLFLIGLADFLLSNYPLVGKVTIFSITFCAALYIFSTFAPFIDPQSPYHTSFSYGVWYLTRKLHKRSCKDRFGLSPRPLKSNMAEGQMQLAMEKNDARKDRDERAIRWLVTKLTEDGEMESLASGIPGSFDPEWGVKVWNSHLATKKGESTTSSLAASGSAPAPQNDNYLKPVLPPMKRGGTLGSFFNHVNPFPNTRHPSDSLPRIGSPLHHDSRPGSLRLGVPSQQGLRPASPSHNGAISASRPLSSHGEVIDELCQRIQRLFGTCNHRDSFLNEDEWRKRSRACVETAASFVFCMDADIGSFGDIGKLLSELGSAEKTREVSAISLNRSFVSRWTCLSIVVIRKLLDSDQLQENASGAIQTFETFYVPDNFNANRSTPAEMASMNACDMDAQFVKAWDCVEELRQKIDALSEADRRGGKVEEVLHDYDHKLEGIKEEADRMKVVDKCISVFQHQIDQVTHNLIRQLPGVAFDEITEPTPLGHVFDFLASPVHPQLLHLSQRLLGLGALSQKRSSRGYIETAEILKTVDLIPLSVRKAVNQHRLMERQLWRLEDLRAGAFGFTLELYFLSLRQILSTFTLQHKPIHVSFNVSAFKVITSDWDRFKGSRGTMQIILNLVCDIAMPDRGIFSNCPYPGYVTKELLEMLENMVKGQATRSSYINDAMKELKSEAWRASDKGFRDEALRIFRDHSIRFRQT